MNIIRPQSNELTRGPPELVQHQHFRLYGMFTSAQESCMVLNIIWFGNIARQSQWGGGVNFLVQMISTCLRVEGGGSAPCDWE
jgi:hypothetical protein